MTAKAMLAALVARYWAGGVTLEQAAKLLGIRKQAFADYADDYLFVQVIENMAWRYYLGAFNRLFPECDPRCVRRDCLPMLKPDNLLRGGSARSVTTYDAEQTKHLPPAQPHLHNPLSDAERNGNDFRTNPSKIEVGIESPPAPLPRALPRDNGQHPLDPVPLDTSGPEFVFKAA